jgi:hypothetical protein
MTDDGDVPCNRKLFFTKKLGKFLGCQVESTGMLYNDILEITTGIGCEGTSWDIKINYCPMCGRKL